MEGVGGRKGIGKMMQLYFIKIKMYIIIKNNDENVDKDAESRTYIYS